MYPNMDFFNNYNDQEAEGNYDLRSHLSSRVEPNNMAGVPPPEAVNAIHQDVPFPMAGGSGPYPYPMPGGPMPYQYPIDPTMQWWPNSPRFYPQPYGYPPMQPMYPTMPVRPDATTAETIPVVPPVLHRSQSERRSRGADNNPAAPARRPALSRLSTSDRPRGVPSTPQEETEETETSRTRTTVFDRMDGDYLRPRGRVARGPQSMSISSTSHSSETSSSYAKSKKDRHAGTSRGLARGVLDQVRAEF